MWKNAVKGFIKWGTYSVIVGIIFMCISALLLKEFRESICGMGLFLQIFITACSGIFSFLIYKLVGFTMGSFSYEENEL